MLTGAVLLIIGVTGWADTGFIPADGPPYLLAALACVPVAALGFAAGWMRARDNMDDEDRMIDRALQ